MNTPIEVSRVPPAEHYTTPSAGAIARLTAQGSGPDC